MSSQDLPNFSTSSTCTLFNRPSPKKRGRPAADLPCDTCKVIYKEHLEIIDGKLVRSYDLIKRGKKRTSPIWDVPAEEFKKAIDDSISFEDIVRRLGIVSPSGRPADITTITRRCNELGIDISKLPSRRKNLPAFIENSTYSEVAVKRKIFCQKLLPYVCVECGITEWRGKPISLQLDHKNGVCNDHRLENLRLLCPNCHSQTATYTGKRHLGRNRKLLPTEEASKNITSEITRVPIARESNSKNCKIDWPTDGDLIEKICQSSILAVAQILGVTDNSIKKRLKKHGKWEEAIRRVKGL